MYSKEVSIININVDHKFIQRIIIKTLKVVTHQKVFFRKSLSKVTCERNLQGKKEEETTCSNRESLFRKIKKLRKFSWHMRKISLESHFRKRLPKENFLVCHYLKATISRQYLHKDRSFGVGLQL